MSSNLFFTINFAFSILAALIALTVALIILTTVALTRHCRTRPNLLICNTSVATICYYLLNLLSVYYGSRRDWAVYQPACTFRAYCYTVLCAAICYSYSIQALSRLFFTVLYMHKYLQTWSVHWTMIIVSWSVSILAPLIPLLFFQHGYRLEEESHLCLPTVKVFSTSMCAVVIAFLIPLNFVTVIYGLIFCFARRSTHRIRSFTARLKTASMTSQTALLKVKREIKLIKNILILICLLLFGGTPYLTLVLWHALSSRPLPPSFYLLSTNFIAIFIALKMVTLFCMCKQIKSNLQKYLARRSRYCP